MTKTSIIITNCLIVLFIPNRSHEQDKSAQFSFSYPIKNDMDRIQLKIENRSNTTVYYSIGIDAFTDTGWVFLLGNLDALGKNEWFGLKMLPSKAIVKKMVSKKEVFKTYYYLKPKKLRFSLLYNTKRSLDGNEKIMEVYP